jgi:hypothetical protein
MNLLSLRGRMAALALGLVAGHLAAHTAHAAAERCFDFSHQEIGTAWPIDPQAALPFDAATVRAHPLVLDGVVQTPDAARFEVVDDAIVGGGRPTGRSAGPGTRRCVRIGARGARAPVRPDRRPPLARPGPAAPPSCGASARP